MDAFIAFLPSLDIFTLLWFVTKTVRQNKRFRGSHKFRPLADQIGEELAEVIQMGGTWVRYVGMYQ